MVIKIINWTCILGMIFLFSFCNKHSEGGESEFLKTQVVDGAEIQDDDIVVFDSKGGEFSIQLTSNIDWSITAPPQWVSVSPKDGRGNQNIVVEVASNQEDKSREGTLNFNNNGRTLSSIKLRQTGVEREDEAVDPIFDLVFDENGRGSDVSDNHRRVETMEGITLTTLYSPSFDRFIARFTPSNPGSTSNSGFYKMDYNNDIDFEDVLRGNNSFESIFMLNAGPEIPDLELKMFSGHQAGGIGFLVSNSDRGHQLTFLPHIGGDYIWTESGITPEKGVYYDVVGVWDKSEGKSYVYVNGELKDVRTAVGSFDFTATAYRWLGIGGDPASETAAQAIWKGDVVLARVFDKALTEEEVKKLWETNKEGIRKANEDREFSDINIPFGRFLVGDDYTIEGEGFEDGDIILIEGVDDPSIHIEVHGHTVGDPNGFTFVLPTAIRSGRYRFLLKRNDSNIDFGFTSLLVVNTEEDLETKIIAHRGYYRTEGAAENSIASLKNAQEIGVYGSEFDIQMTLDGELVIHHDDDINGILISDANYGEIKNTDIGNGEGLPLFSEFLSQGKKDSEMKLIVELKDQHSNAKNDEMAGKVVDMVKNYDMTDQVVYISFSPEACKKVHELQPEVPVYTLSPFWSLEELVSRGMTGIDYNISAFREDPDLIDKAHDLGLKVNVWTIDSESDIFDMSLMGADFITTNEPVLATEITDDAKEH